MATKTWKIGEYAKGGIIQVVTKGQTITVIGKDWDYSKGTRRGSDQSGAKEWIRKEYDADTDIYRDMMDFLCDLTTSYYADTIVDWIKTKVELNTFVGGIHW